MKKEEINALYLKAILRNSPFLFMKTEKTPSLQILTKSGWLTYQYAASFTKFSIMLTNAIKNRHNFVIKMLQNKQSLKWNNDAYDNYFDTHEEDNRNGKFVFYLVILLENGAISDYTFNHVENFLDILEILIQSNIYFEVDARFVEDK